MSEISALFNKVNAMQDFNNAEYQINAAQEQKQYLLDQANLMSSSATDLEADSATAVALRKKRAELETVSNQLDIEIERLKASRALASNRERAASDRLSQALSA